MGIRSSTVARKTTNITIYHYLTTRNMKILVLLTAFVAIEARPQSVFGGNLITSFVSNTPTLETVIVKTEPVATRQTQPLVVRASSGEVLVLDDSNSKPTVVYESPKRIIQRKITCFSNDISACRNAAANIGTGGGSSSSGGSEGQIGGANRGAGGGAGFRGGVRGGSRP